MHALIWTAIHSYSYVCSFVCLLLTSVHCLSQGIICEELPESPDGRIEYSSGSLGDQLFGVRATTNCNDGFGLAAGDIVRTCDGNSSSSAGHWTGTTALCQS